MMNEYGEPVEDDEWREVRTFRPSTPLELFNNDLMNATVRAYRLAKNPKKLSDFERCALDGTTWTRRLRVRLLVPSADDVPGRRVGSRPCEPRRSP